MKKKKHRNDYLELSESLNKDDNNKLKNSVNSLLANSKREFRESQNLKNSTNNNNSNYNSKNFSVNSSKNFNKIFWNIRK